MPTWLDVFDLIKFFLQGDPLTGRIVAGGLATAAVVFAMVVADGFRSWISRWHV